MSDFDDFSDFEPENEDDFEISLVTLREDAAEAIELQKFIDELESQASEVKARLRHIVEKRMPYVMREIGISKFELEDGSKVSIKESVSGSLNRSPDIAAAKQFLIDNDAGDLLKTEVKMEFGKGSHNEALSVAAELREKGYDVIAAETIHAQTLAAFGRELLKKHTEKLENGESSEPPPFELLGLFHAKKADIRLKKEKE